MPTRQVPRKPVYRGCGVQVARAGFSLVELLVVIGMIVLLSALIAPSLQRMGGSNRMGRAVSELPALLELARTEAMARSTYVWVGFANRTNSSGNAELSAVAFASRDGTPIASGALLEPITKVLSLDGIELTSKEQLSPAVQSLYEKGTTAAVSSVAHPKTLPSVQSIPFNRTLTFTPNGEAMLDSEPSPSTGFENVIDISLRPMRGKVADPTSRDHASIWLYGGSGRLQIYRL